MAKKKNKRIRLLNDAEIEDIYGLPQFDQSKRIHYFTLNSDEESELNELLFTHSKLHFILQLGYFKAKRQLFKFKYQEVEGDIDHVIEMYFPNESIPKKLPSRNAIALNNKRILQLTGYQDSPKKAAAILSEKTKQLTRRLTNPIVILRELFIHLEQQCFVFPEYSTLQDILGKELRKEEKRLCSLVANLVTDKTEILLDKLLTFEDFSYEITSLKQHPKNFNFNQIQQELEKHKTYYYLYKFSTRFLPKLGISQQNIAYYASLIDYYDVQAMYRFPKEKSRLYMLCYVYHRFQKMNDHLIQTFLYYVDKYMKEAKEYAKQKSKELNLEANKNFPLAGELLDIFLGKHLSKFVFDKIQERAYGILPEDKIALVSQALKNMRPSKLQYTWDFHSENYQSVIKNLRPIFIELNFDANTNDKNLLNGIDFIKSIFKSGKPLSKVGIQDFPEGVIPNRLKAFMLKTATNSSNNDVKPLQSIYPYKYEFLIYQQLKRRIDSNKIYSNDTTQYRSFEADIGIRNANKNKKEILKCLEETKLNRPIEEILLDLKEAIETLIIDVNQRIDNGENKHIKIKRTSENRTWTLPYQKKEDEVNNPFYDQLTTIHVNDLLDYVDQQTHFMRAFTHIKQHRSKTTFDRQCIKGCIIADGTGLGIFKMAEACDLGYKSMLNSHHDFIRLETIRNANDIISNATAALPIFKHYNLSQEIFHGSADAQKYRVKNDTFNSRHSQKYFATAKGVAPYTLILNHVPINCNMRGSHEHESHNLYDLLFNNDAGFDLDRVSTDTAGSNQVNFALLDARFIDYTPCYKSIGTKVSRICTFNDPENYKDFLVKPAYQVDEKLIINEWPNILPIYAALMMKETTQSVVVKKLCSHFRKSRTKNALWEYNNILMSIYLLRYIDDPILRQHVRAALNRGEAYHQLRRAIAEANGKEFRGGSDTEIAIWNECGRLIANAVIFYNAYLLSRLLEIKERQGDIEAGQFIIKLSPVAYQHINFKGLFEFNKGGILINIDEILAVLDKALKKRAKN